jgi:hypothetical protein
MWDGSGNEWERGRGHGSGISGACVLLSLLIHRYSSSHSGGICGAATGVGVTAGVTLGAATGRGNHGCS